MEKAEELEVKVQQLLEEQGFLTGILGDYIIVAAQHHIDDGGETFTSVSYLTPVAVPHYRLFGLLDMADALLRRDLDGVEE